MTYAAADEVISNVSKALAQSFRETVARVSGESWEDTGVTLPCKEVWERYGRAATGALREPSREMILAGYKALMDWDARTGDDHGILEVWQAMIDAALAEPPSNA